MNKNVQTNRLFGIYLFAVVAIFVMQTVDVTQATWLSLDTSWNFSNVARSKRDVCDEVNSIHFKCRSGQCIDFEDKCNGKVDCNDGSDETRETCLNEFCPGYTFKCDYGACIDGFGRCNGTKECLDGSDEQNCGKRKPTTPKSKSPPTLAQPSTKTCSGFKCNSGACIDLAKRCNGVKDCLDNSDEINCVIDSNDILDGNCSSNHFECESGQCIDLEDKCNGKVDCNDGSDETRETCLNVFCPGYTFKCDYGACIDGFGRCNGIRECLDGSDEVKCGKQKPTTTEPTPSPTPEQPYSGGCTMPNNPENGYWTSGAILGAPGTTVAPSTLLILKCDSGYRVAGLGEYNHVACLNNIWTPKLPTCEKLCPAQYSENMMQVKCFEDDRALKEISCNKAIHNSIAKVDCARYFEFPDRPLFRSPQTRYCYNGKWNLDFPQCVPVCGEKKSSARTLIVNGENVERGNYPWTTAIFQKFDQEIVNVCGGSMLTQNIILTAAHCVTDNYGNPLSVSVIKIAVGKYFNKYKDVRDANSSQYSDIEMIIKQEKYHGGENNYQSDIALLITKKKINFSKYVQPVCFQNLNQINLRYGQEGVVTGWGYTGPNKDPSDELKEVTVPYKDDDTCKKELKPEFYIRYATLDKFCAGLFNKSIAVCNGDSGGGLVFKNKDERYYVMGIVSVAYIEKGKCNIEVSSLYTNVKSHYEWLEENVSKYTRDTQIEPRTGRR